MFKIGYLTVILYLVSLTFFLYAVFYDSFLYTGTALGTLFFIIPSVMIGIMVKMRINT
ncbi:MAG TPA: hypothetical protein PKY82_01325 [Pyrinomonadaceae bacterium]|nr:hypothetical protein [Pyrinomonadaceae bacterium]